MIRYHGQPYEGSDDQANDMVRAEQRRKVDEQRDRCKFSRKPEEVEAISISQTLALGWDRMPWWLKDAASAGVVVIRADKRELKIMQPKHVTCVESDWIVRTTAGDGVLRRMSAADFAATYERIDE